MNTNIVFEDEFGPLGEGESVIRQYFVCNTPPKFNFHKFLLEVKNKYHHSFQIS